MGEDGRCFNAPIGAGPFTWFIDRMLTEVRAGPYTIRGISVGGVYTCLQLPELGVVLDAGVPIRSFAGTDRIFLSHGHSDHASALPSLLGIRRLIGKGPPDVFLPAESEPALLDSLRALTPLLRCDLGIRSHPLRPGDVVPLGHDLHARAFRTHHGVASLGYQFLRRVKKLRPQYTGLPGAEIARLRREGAEGVFDELEHLEVAYATDTLSNVLEAEPTILRSRVLILECTFVDEHRTVEQVRQRMHVHLDELIARADAFENEALVLMHFSQGYSPAQIHEALERRLPEALKKRVIPFAPRSGRWFG